jgi:hypothetical protein
MRRGCDPSKNIAGEQAHCDAVRVGDDNRIVDLKPERRNSWARGVKRAAQFCLLHAVLW